MPKMNQKVTAPPLSPAPPPLAVAGPSSNGTAPSGRPIAYPNVEVLIYSGLQQPGHRGPITEEVAKKILRWMSEEDYIEKAAKELSPERQAEIKAKGQTLGYGEHYDFRDEFGKKIRCENNCGNRPLKMEGARKYAQDILNKAWHFNLENIIISRTGIVTSGQHRLIGLIIACQLWRKEGKAGDRWRKVWKEAPYIQSLVAVGGSDDPVVIGTVDNVIPRTLSDVIYTSEYFNTLAPGERKECSRMMAVATELAFQRTGASAAAGTHYETNATDLVFIDHHPKIKRAVKHIFEENRDRALSNYRLSPGQCAGLLYLMAASRTDGDAYRGARKESKIDFAAEVPYLGWKPTEKKPKPPGCWEAAEEFWTQVASSDKKVHAIADAFAACAGKGESGASLDEKIGILCLAWNLWSHDKAVTKADLQLSYGTKDNKTMLVDHPNVGGIDLGKKAKSIEEEKEDKEPTEEEVAKQKEEERQQRFRDQVKKLQENRKTQKEQAEVFRERYYAEQSKLNGTLLLWKTQTNSWAAWGLTADKINTALKVKPVAPSDGVSRAIVGSDDLAVLTATLKKSKVGLALAEEVNGKVVVKSA